MEKCAGVIKKEKKKVEELFLLKSYIITALIYTLRAKGEPGECVKNEMLERNSNGVELN